MKQDSEKIQAHVWVSGRVQGVGYRYSTVIQAEKLGLKGWVKNLADGRVEAVFEGDKQTVEQMIQWCYQGSSSAIVKEVNVELGDSEGLETFEVRY